MDVAEISSLFTSLPTDVVAIVVFATLITVVTLRMGASVAIALSMALVVANVLYAAIPTTFMIGGLVSGATSSSVAAGIYVALSLLLTFVIYRMTSTLSDDSARPLFAIATGLATTVVVLTVWHLAPQLQSLWSFSGLIEGAFGADYRLYWILLAFVAFAFVKS